MQVADRLTGVKVGKDDVAYADTPGCGCDVPVAPCEQGVGEVGCAMAPGSYSDRALQQQQARDAAGSECAEWPQCTPRVIGVDLEGSADEFTTQCVHAHRCRMLVRRPGPPSTDTENTFSDIFGGFSLRQGLRTVGSETPGRRRCAEGANQGGALWSDDCPPVLSKYTGTRRLLYADDGYTPRYRDMVLASRGFKAMMEDGQGSYAGEQFRGLQRDVAELVDLLSRARAQIATQWPSWAETVETTREAGGGLRRALLGVSDDAMCVVKSVQDSNLRPNTYPCCRGRWSVLSPLARARCAESPLCTGVASPRPSPTTFIPSRTGSSGATRGTRSPGATTSAPCRTHLSSSSAR